MKAIVKGESYESSYGLNSRGYFTPYYFTQNDRQLFISNLVTSINDPYEKDEYKRSEMAKRLRNLRTNNYKFIRFYGREKTPIDFINFVLSNNYTFEIHGELFLKCNDSCLQ